MKTLRITRISTEAKKGTFGALTVDGMPIGVTLTPPDHDNDRNISSIPTGRYIMKPYYSNKFGKTWRVCDVPNRDSILFHPGNLLDHTEGCFIVAQHFGKLQGQWAVLNSGKTFKALLSLLNGSEEAELIITESY